MKVRLHARARADLASIRAYLLHHAGALPANRVRQHLQVRLRNLGNKPDLGTRSSEPDIWILPPTLYPYRIYYLVTPDAVVVLHIRHTSRHLPILNDLLP